MKRGTLFLVLFGGACSFNSGAGQGDAGVSSGDDATAGSGTTAATTQGTSGSTDGVDGTQSGSETLEPGTTSTSDDTSSTTSSGGETTGSPGDTSGSSSTGGDPYLLCDDSNPDLRACYDLSDVGGGVLTDLSSHGNDGTVGAVGVEDGPFGGAVRTSGSEEIAVADSASLDVPNTITFEAWVWVDSLPQPDNRYGVFDNDGQYSLFVYPDGFRCDAGLLSAFTEGVPLEQWVHVACTYDGDTMFAWVGGELAATATGGSALGVDNGNPLSIGDGSPEFDTPLDGLVAAVRIWSVIRTEDEIVAAAAAD